MVTLTIGLVGIDVDWSDPEALTIWSSPNGRSLSISGDIVGATLAETKIIHDELVSCARSNKTIAVTWSVDTIIDGYYRVTNAYVDIRTLVDTGFAPFQVTLEFVGTEADVKFEDTIVGTVRANDMGVDATEAEPYLSPPIGTYAFEVGSSTPVTVTRTGVDGSQVVYRDVPYTTNPTWSVTPGGYYDGAATVKISGYTRAGLTCPNTPTDWELSNGLVKVTPDAIGGRLDVAHYDGAQWDTAKVWRIQAAGGDVGVWEAVSILRNDPEEASIRLERSMSGAGAVTLDLSLRRGSRFVTCRMSRSVGVTLGIVLATAEAGTAITPAGATAAVAVRATATDADGNRYLAGTPTTPTFDLVNGGLSVAATTTLDFFIGSVIDGALAVAGDQAADLCLQYLGAISEQTEPVPR